MKNLGKIILNAFLGIGIGSVLNLLFSFINGEFSAGVPSFLKQFESANKAVLMMYLCYALIGVVSYFSGKFYEKTTLLKASILNFIAIFVTVGFVGKYLHWFTNFTSFLFFGIVFFITFMIIWAIFYFINKNEVEKVNRMIE